MLICYCNSNHLYWLLVLNCIQRFYKMCSLCENVQIIFLKVGESFKFLFSINEILGFFQAGQLGMCALASNNLV